MPVAPCATVSVVGAAVIVKSGVAWLHDGNEKEATFVRQLPSPFVGMYWFT